MTEPRRRVLIVDDEPNIVVSLEFLLRQQGYEVLVARDGEEALAAVVERRPELVVLDVMLPGLDGFEVCRRLRERADLAGLKIVLLTARGRRVTSTCGRCARTWRQFAPGLDSDPRCGHSEPAANLRVHLQPHRGGLMPTSEYTLFSGGAPGTEAEFGRMAEKYGVQEVTFTFEGHKIERSRGLRVLTPEELMRKDVSLSYVSKLLNRTFTNAAMMRIILHTIIYQIDSGHEFFVDATTGFGRLLRLIRSGGAAAPR